MVHQVGRPFYQSWQQGQQYVRRATSTTKRTHQLPIAGQNRNKPPGPQNRPPIPKPPLPVNPLVTVTSLLTGAARNRVGGVSLAGWQRHTNSGIVTPSPATTRNPRSRPHQTADWIVGAGSLPRRP